MRSPNCVIFRKSFQFIWMREGKVRNQSMKLLAVDTSGPVCGMAVLEDDRIRSELIAQNKNTHSASLLPMVEQGLALAGLPLAEMDALAVVVGPGSFTGVRIGVATVKALAHGSGKPCIPVDALEALARSAGPAEHCLVCPLQDARAGQVYGACFFQGERRMEDAAMKLEDFLAEARRLHGGPLLLTGDGADAHREKIRRILGGDARFPEAPFRFLRPAAVGQLALEKGKPVDWRALKEYYLRPPNAEKNKKLLEAMRRG